MVQALETKQSWDRDRRDEDPADLCIEEATANVSLGIFFARPHFFLSICSLSTFGPFLTVSMSLCVLSWF
jgi:hypothetical protein